MKAGTTCAVTKDEAERTVDGLTMREQWIAVCFSNGTTFESSKRTARLSDSRDSFRRTHTFLLSNQNLGRLAGASHRVIAKDSANSH